MAINAATVIDVAPELASIATDRISRFIEYARPYINRRIWGIKSDYAHALYTAHLLRATANSNSALGPAGPITSESVGDLSVSYGGGGGGGSTTEFNPLADTVYGRLLIQLRKTLLITPIVVR